jgi:hypothetical protein
MFHVLLLLQGGRDGAPPCPAYTLCPACLPIAPSQEPLGAVADSFMPVKRIPDAVVLNSWLWHAVYPRLQGSKGKPPSRERVRSWVPL